MADKHGELYDRIVAERDERRRRRAARPEEARGAARVGRRRRRGAASRDRDSADRPLDAKPLVTIVIPCFNHGRWLSETIGSIEEQDYPSIETIVVDDCSTDAHTIALARRARAERPCGGRPHAGERRPEQGTKRRHRARARALPPPRRRRQPAAARRRSRSWSRSSRSPARPSASSTRTSSSSGIATTTRSRRRGTPTGSCSPTTATRARSSTAPCSTRDSAMPRTSCSDTRTGTSRCRLASSGIRGEPAAGPTVLVRKHGFTRSDLVHHVVSGVRRAHAATPRRAVRRRAHGDGSGRSRGLRHASRPSGARTSRSWRSSRSTRRARPGDDSHARLEHQTCGDAEFLAPLSGRWRKTWRGPHVRRIPPGSDELPEGRLGVGLALARGRVVLVSSGTALAIARGRGRDREARARVREPAGRRHRLHQPSLGGDAAARYRARAGSVDGPPRARLAHRGGLAAAFTGTTVGDELGSLARALVAGGARLHWRYLRGPTTPACAGRRRGSTSGDHRHDPSRCPRRSRARRRDRRAGAATGNPVRRTCSTVIAGSAARSGTCRSTPSRLRASSSTTCSAPCAASRRPARRSSTRPRREASSRTRFPRRERLDRAGRPLPREPRADGVPRTRRPRARHHVRDRPARARRRARRSAARRGRGRRRARMGRARAAPSAPVVSEPSTFGLSGLFRSLDTGARRHRYAVGQPPAGELVGELGALHDEPQAGSVPLWITDDGRVATASAQPVPGALSTRHPAALDGRPRELAWLRTPRGARAIGRAPGARRTSGDLAAALGAAHPERRARRLHLRRGGTGPRCRSSPRPTRSRTISS